MSLQPVITSYEPFSKSPEYLEANREFLKTLHLPEAAHLLDLACGTGVMTDAALAVRPRLRVTGIDLSRESLLLAQEHFAAGRPDVFLVRGTADVLPFPDTTFDAGMMGNAIHILRDPLALAREIRRVLRPGAIFAFNSSFYAGTFAPGTERFYHDWVKEALRWIQEEDRALRARGLPGIPRRREARGGAFTNRWRTPAEWGALFEEAGFATVRLSERVVPMTGESFEAVGAYAGMAEVLLSGYPVASASAALQAAVAPALRSMSLTTVPRNWLEAVVVRKENG
ncbi:MAG: class I SAM-dependent methyltransferase [Candidatus Polarisedimenticolia bacterium]